MSTASQTLNTNEKTEIVRQEMVRLTHEGRGDEASALYEHHLEELKMVGLPKDVDESVFEANSQTLGSVGQRHTTTDEETQELTKFSTHLNTITARIPLSHRQGALNAVQDEINNISGALTLATSVTAGKTINESEAAKLGDYTGWASSDFVGTEMNHIASGADDSHRKFTSENGAERFGLQDAQGRAITTQTQLDDVLKNSPDKPVFLYRYPPENPIAVNESDIQPVDLKTSFGHRAPTNYPTALSGQALINTLAGGLSVLVTSKQTFDSSALVVTAAQRGFEKYYNEHKGELGLSDSDVETLKNQIQLVNNRNWETRVDHWSAVAGMGVGETMQNSRLESELPDDVKESITLELAGVNGYYIHGDMQDQAAELSAGLAKRIMSNNGRVCVKPAVVFVQQDAYVEFKKELGAHFQARHDNADSEIGLAIDKSFKQGPMFNDGETGEHNEHVAYLSDKGFDVVGYDGQEHARSYPGRYVSPFVAFADSDGTKEEVAAFLESDREIFSANTIVVPVADEKEAVDFMNISGLALGDGFATHDLDVALHIFNNLETGGSVHWNDLAKFVSDNAPRNQHAHNQNNLPNGIKKAGVTGSLDSLRQLFTGATDFADKVERIPNEQALAYLETQGFNLPANDEEYALRMKA